MYKESIEESKLEFDKAIEFFIDEAGKIRTGRASGKAFAQLLRCRDLCGSGLCGI